MVAAHIRRLVVEGRYRAGERVRQDEIADELGVSRIPVREAIIALEREGWVTIEPHRGAFVNGLDAEFIRDHFELHGAIVGLTAARVVQRADEQAVQALVAAAARVVDAPDDPATFDAITYEWVDIDGASGRRAAAQLDDAGDGQPVSRATTSPRSPGPCRCSGTGWRPSPTRSPAATPTGPRPSASGSCSRHGVALTELLAARGMFDEPDPSPAAALR